MKNNTYCGLTVKGRLIRTSAFLALIFSLFSFTVNAQVFWTETFSNGCTANCGAAAYTTGPNGPWTVASTGVNDPEGSEWFVSCAEGLAHTVDVGKFVSMNQMADDSFSKNAGTLFSRCRRLDVIFDLAESLVECI